MSDNNDKNQLSADQKYNLIEFALLIVFACFLLQRCG